MYTGTLGRLSLRSILTKKRVHIRITHVRIQTYCTMAHSALTLTLTLVLFVQPEKPPPDLTAVIDYDTLTMTSLPGYQVNLKFAPRKIKMSDLTAITDYDTLTQ